MITNLFKPSLLRWQLRQLLVVNVAFVLAASLYVLLRTPPMVFVMDGELLAVFAHSGLLAWSLGRVGSRRVGFLYMLGFTRDQIVFQTLLASAVSGLLVCGVAWLLMVSGARSFVQDRWYENMYFPFIAPEEYFVPWVWLLGYAVFLPLLHYVWIRSAQPYRGGASGWMLLVLGLYFCVWSFDRCRIHAAEPGFLLGVAALFVPAALLLTLACWRVHQTVEVRV